MVNSDNINNLFFDNIIPVHTEHKNIDDLEKYFKQLPVVDLSNVHKYKNNNYYGKYSKKIDGAPYGYLFSTPLLKENHPLWSNENSLANRLNRFIDEKYTLVDSDLSSQKIILICTIIIIILQLVYYFITVYNNRSIKEFIKSNIDAQGKLDSEENITIKKIDLLHLTDKSILSKYWEYSIRSIQLLSTSAIVYFSLNNGFMRTTNNTWTYK